MSTQELQQRTAVNIQEKANLIWAIADKLVGTYKPHEYGQVILPLCVIKRFNDCLKKTHDEVIGENESLGDMDPEMKAGFLCEITGYDFYNTSKFTLDSLLADPDNIGDNFKSYLQNFSSNVIDIIKNFNFEREIDKLDENGILFNVIQEFGKVARQCYREQHDSYKKLFEDKEFYGRVCTEMAKAMYLGLQSAAKQQG